MKDHSLGEEIHNRITEIFCTPLESTHYTINLLGDPGSP